MYPIRTRGVVAGVATAGIMLMAGCGGGGGSSGGGQVYSGNETLVFTSPQAPGFRSSDTFPISVTVSGSRVTVTDVDQATFSGTLDGDNAFVATGSIPGGDLGDGIICAGITLTYRGSIQQNRVTGTSSGTANCRSGGLNIIVRINGTFSTATQAKATLSERSKTGALKSAALAADQ